MLTLFFMALAGGGWFSAMYTRHELNRERYMNDQLPSADTDEDVIGVLEASGAEIAPKLLKAAELVGDQAEWHHVPNVTPPATQWQLLVRDMDLEATEKGKLEVLYQWLARGFVLTQFECVELAGKFKDAEIRKQARVMMTDAMNDDE